MKKTKKKLTMQKVADLVGCHIDTVFRMKSGRNKPSPDMAKRFEDALGIDRRRFLWPDEFGDPWDILKERKAQ